MIPIVAPPLRPGHAADRIEADPLPFTPLYLLWIGLAFVAVNYFAPDLLSFIRLDNADRHLLTVGLALPAFLSKRPIAQPIAAVLIGFAVLAFYLEYLRQGQLPS
jgi:hypothetical protein